MPVKQQFSVRIHPHHRIVAHIRIQVHIPAGKAYGVFRDEPSYLRS